MPSAESLFDDGKETVEKAVDIDETGAFERDYYSSLDSDEDAYATIFDIVGTVEFVSKNSLQRVALQLPDELLPQAWRIIHLLQTASETATVDASFFILGDTSYGSCCVDEVAALHNDADAIIHYGRTCLSMSNRLPVYYVFGRLPLDVDSCISELKALISADTRIYLVYDCRYEHAVEQLCGKLEKIFTSVEPGLVGPRCRMIEKGSEGGREANVLGLQLQLPEEKTGASALVYVGAETSQVTQLALKYNSYKLFTYNPVSGMCEDASRRSNGLLSKRFYKIECAKDAKIFGLLVGTMGVKGYATVLNHLRDVIKTAGRKCYTFSVGKLNPNKLANFTHVDVYVLVACPQNSLIDSKDFYRPIVTPIEVEIALGVQQWSSSFSLDFQDLMKEAASRREEFNVTQQETDDSPHFSPITGQLVSPSTSQKHTEEASTDKSGTDTQIQSLGARHITLRYSSPAADLLAEQTFRGLDDKVGNKPPSAAVPGQTGIASALYNINDDTDQSAR